jgi:hypothetical protein
MKGPFLGPSRGSTELRQGFRVPSHWLLNDDLADTILTSDHSSDFEDALMVVWGRQGSRQGGGRDKSKVLVSRETPRMDFGLGQKRQRSVYAM